MGGVKPFVLTFGRGQYATDSGDHVFAMLGLMKEARRRASGDVENEPLVLDYTKSVEEVFAECAAFSLRNYIWRCAVTDNDHQH